MRSIKLGLALVAALAFSATVTASASAASFISSETKAKLLSEGVQSQVFKTNAGEVKCSEAKIEAGETGTVDLPESVQLAEIHYGNCLAFGFVPTTLKNADYLFLPNGTVHIDSEVTIVGGGCEVKVPAQSVGTVKYSDNGNNIKIEPNVTGILYTAKSCPSGNGEAKNGTYTGNSEAMIASGAVEFVADENAGVKFVLFSTTFGGAGKATLRVIIVNHTNLAVEITANVVAFSGQGAIINTGTCKPRERMAANGGTCEYSQEDPVGGNVGVEWI